MEIFEQDPVLRQLFKDGLTAREVPKDANGNYISGGLMQGRPLTMRLMSLTLENFRAFRGETEFDFQGRNVLVYGENGSGKTSIWSAIDLFLEATLAKSEANSRANFGKNRYQFNRQPGRVEFEVLNELGNYLPNAVWSRDDTPFQHPDFMPSARVSARLDYRSMWETYFLQRKHSQVNIGPLLIETLIPYVSTISGPTFSELWSDLERMTVGGLSINTANYVIAGNLCSAFGNELQTTLDSIKDTAQNILSHLSPGLEFDWKVASPKMAPALTNARSSSRAHLRYLKKPRVILTATLQGNALKNHHNLLNEARLSALALSIYLAAAKMNAYQARSGFKILALDDVLIGLDMSNRLPVLEVLDTWFKDWQIFLFTYDRIWYEIAKARLDEDTWKKFEFFASSDVPVWNEDLDGFDKASEYLLTARRFAGLDKLVNVTPDYKAAGVYARTAFEILLKRFFQKHEVPVAYQIDGKHMLGELWPVMETLESDLTVDGITTRDCVLSKEFRRDMDIYTRNSLNPLCHSGFFQCERREVEKAVAAVETLKTELRKNHKKVAPPEPPSSAPVQGVNVNAFDLSSLSPAELGALNGRVVRLLKEQSGKGKN